MPRELIRDIETDGNKHISTAQKTSADTTEREIIRNIETDGNKAHLYRAKKQVQIQQNARKYEKDETIWSAK